MLVRCFVWILVIRSGLGSLQDDPGLLQDDPGLLQDDLEQRFLNLEKKLSAVESELKEVKAENVDMKKRISVLESEHYPLRKSQPQNHWKTELDSKVPQQTDPADLHDVTGDVTREPEDLEERVAKLEELSKINVLRTCDEYTEYGFTINAKYSIDPDGKGIGAPPIEVFCDFDTGSTEVLHNAEDQVEITHCDGSDCHYEMSVNYSSASMSQMVALIEVSEFCEQDIRFDCMLAPLSHDGTPIGVWLNRNGDPETYFDGANHGTHMCQCSLTSSCHNPDDQCNCDASNVPEEMFDAGTITDQTALPITGFRYGQLGFELQRAFIRFGRLKCYGAADLPDNEVASSCRALKLQGAIQTGFYQLMADKTSGITTTAFCNFDFGLDDIGLETVIGRSDLRGAISFEVHEPVRNNGYLPSGTITYSSMSLNLGGGMNPDSGRFTVPRTGKYYFAATAEAYDNNVLIELYVNGVKKQSIHDIDGATHRRVATFFFVVNVEEGNQVWLEVDADDDVALGGTPFRFMGFVLPEF